MEMAPKLWDGELPRMLWEEVFENDVERSAGDAEKVARHGVVVRDDGTALLPLFLGFEMDDAIWNGEIFAKSPFVLERRLEGMVAVRCSWMLAGVRWGSGSKSSGACQVLRAPVKYCCGQKT